MTKELQAKKDEIIHFINTASNRDLLKFSETVVDDFGSIIDSSEFDENSRELLSFYISFMELKIILKHGWE